MLTETHRFKKHVGFDNLPVAEATKHNIPSLTLNTKHQGYRAGRRSRTFMVGVDEHSYSDYALQWLLDELVDDGDEVVCVRVSEKEFRAGDSYEEDGNKMLKYIVQRNTNNKALSFVLEYASGKLHTTFQKLVCAPPPLSTCGTFH
jgi:Universal stress protein family